MEIFNAYPVSDDESQRYVDNLHENLFSAEDGLPAEVKQLVRDKLFPYYVRASLLAKSNQKTYKRAGLLVYSFSVLAVGSVAIGILFHSLSVWAFAVELVLLVTILVTIIRANHKRAHKNWIQARYITERIRAAIFLTTCGVETSLVRSPANVGVTGNPDEWTILAFNEIARQLPVLTLCHGQPSEKFIAFARRAWLGEQIAFHQRIAREAEQKNVWLERFGIMVFAAALIAAAMHLLLIGFHLAWLEHLLTFAAIFLPAVGAAIGGIRTHREYSRLAIRSHNMAQSLKALDDRLATVTTPKAFSSVLTQVEELTLMELQDWLMLMSVAKLEAA